MPNYPWSCLACGQTNPSRAELCSACSCPARATSKQIRTSRAEHISCGGTLQHQAAIDATEEHLSAVDILGRPLLFFFLGPQLTKVLFPHKPPAEPG
jgi:hypothetical protein